MKSLCGFLALWLLAAGCALPQQSAALKARLRAQTEQLEALQTENANLRASHQKTVAALQQTEAQLAQLDRRSAAMEEQLTLSERQRQMLRSQFSGLVGNPGLPTAVTRELAELAREYPALKFDEQTGIGKLETDILFPSGDAELSPEAEKLLQQLVSLFMSPQAQALRMVVAGHSDSRQVATRNIRERYPNNWHLSAARALAVTDYLCKLGFPEDRLAVAAFAGHQPVAPSDDPGAEHRNRRVEIFILGPETPVVGWTETIPSLYRR